jgi:hypothetical protein
MEALDRHAHPDGTGSDAYEGLDRSSRLLSGVNAKTLLSQPGLEAPKSTNSGDLRAENRTTCLFPRGG